MNLYPLPGTVSMYRGWSAESPSACRSLFTTVFRALLKINKSSPLPQMPLQLFAPEDLARLLQQEREDLKRLALEPDPMTELAQIARELFEFK